LDPGQLRTRESLAYGVHDELAAAVRGAIANRAPRKQPLIPPDIRMAGSIGGHRQGATESIGVMRFEACLRAIQITLNLARPPVIQEITLRRRDMMPRPINPILLDMV
jgi:hypothetical protein